MSTDTSWVAFHEKQFGGCYVSPSYPDPQSARMDYPTSHIAEVMVAKGKLVVVRYNEEAGVDDVAETD